jgi:DNA-binding NtrC family response regulator
MSLGQVLVVDDDPSIRESIRLVLTRAGYGVLTAANGQEAISLMEHDSGGATICTVLCNLDMPHVKGAELIAHFHTQYPTIPITVLSGADAFQFTEAIVKQGVTDWLSKPASREDILEEVRVSIRLHHLRAKDSGS